jgi:dihydrofolate reductase
MRRLVVSEFVTLDGVMEDPGGAEKSKHGGWSHQFWSEEAARFKFDGRVTYQGFAKAWPSMKDEQGFADRMNGLPKFVVSTTLAEVDWNNSRLIKGDVAEEVSKLKRQPGQDILVAGSARLVDTLMRHDLIDEFRIMVHPVVLGGGKRLFGDGTGTKALRLLRTKKLGSGVVVLHYGPAGAEGTKK